MWKIYEQNGKRHCLIDTPVATTYEIPQAPTTFTTLRGILMDMDGSSTDTEKLVLVARRQMMRESLDDSTFEFASEDYPFIIGDSSGNLVRYLAKKYRAPTCAIPQMIATYYRHYHRILMDAVSGRIAEGLIRPMPRLREFLLLAKELGIKVALVSSSLRKEVDMIMPEVFKGMNLDIPFREYYSAVLTADDVGQPFLKPHPNLYVLAREAMKLAPEECFCIEDSTAGIISARVSGCAVAAVPHAATHNHDTSLANLGTFQGGLQDIIDSRLFMM